MDKSQADIFDFAAAINGAKFSINHQKYFIK
jgi:hypothetical protein